MDVLYFLKERTAFIRQFYERAASPFRERIRLIEAEEELFVPPYSEDGEPPFLDEWIEADESLDVLGHACVSMLSAALKLFLDTYSDELRLRCGHEHKKQFREGGWFNGFRFCFEDAMAVGWEQSQVDLVLLEELVLARNRAQHPTEIHTIGISHSRRDYEKLGKRLFFTDEYGQRVAENLSQTEFSWMRPKVKVSAEQLMTALSTVESFCAWLDREIDMKRRGVNA